MFGGTLLVRSRLDAEPESPWREWIGTEEDATLAPFRARDEDEEIEEEDEEPNFRKFRATWVPTISVVLSPK